MFYSQCPWNRRFKSCESLGCTPKTYVMLSINYTSINEQCKVGEDSESADKRILKDLLKLFLLPIPDKTVSDA